MVLLRRRVQAEQSSISWGLECGREKRSVLCLKSQRRTQGQDPEWFIKTLVNIGSVLSYEGFGLYGTEIKD